MRLQAAAADDDGDVQRRLADKRRVAEDLAREAAVAQADAERAAQEIADLRQKMAQRAGNVRAPLSRRRSPWGPPAGSAEEGAVCRGGAAQCERASAVGLRRHTAAAATAAAITALHSSNSNSLATHTHAHMWLPLGLNQWPHPGCHMACKHSATINTRLLEPTSTAAYSLRQASKHRPDRPVRTHVHGCTWGGQFKLGPVGLAKGQARAKSVPVGV